MRHTEREGCVGRAEGEEDEKAHDGPLRAQTQLATLLRRCCRVSVGGFFIQEGPVLLAVLTWCRPSRLFFHSFLTDTLLNSAIS